MQKFSINSDITEYELGINQLRRFMQQTADEPEDIELSINSFGGDAFLGASLLNELKSYAGNVTVVVTGIAASAASAIAMGADTIKIHKNAMMMLHNPWTYAVGNADELRKAADDLEKVQAAMVHNYTERVDLDKLEPILANESWLTAEEALELGLVDEIVDRSAQKVESKLFASKAKEANQMLVNDIQKPAASAAAPAGLSDAELERIAAMVAQSIQNYKTTEPDENGTTQIEPAETIEEQRENEQKQTEERKEGTSLMKLLLK